MQESPRFRHWAIIVLLAAALLVGILTLPHYGESWDEADIRRYGDYAIRAYASPWHPADITPFDTNLNLYGPSYFALAALLSRVMTSVAPTISTLTAWHAVYFITFLAGLLLLYSLALRWVRPQAALGVAVLFLTQPLLWGHAFMNPKDLPFQTFFLASIYLGLRAVDGLRKSSRIRPSLLVAAAILGLTSSLRVVGPLAGLIVLGYAYFSLGTRAARPALVYVGIALASAFLSWPFLWAAPISRYIESLGTMVDFPFRSSILFDGELYKADQLPAAYFPKLLAIQLTEPALLMIVAGFVLSLVAAANGRWQGPLALLLAWFLLPLGFVLVSRPPMYDNGRQLYFLLPPLFVLAGVAFERLFDHVSRPLAQNLILVAAALPGIVIGARLHPYEYVYYNSLVHGTGGAFRRFEMDYWGTSFDEITRQLNETLPAASKVLVYGPQQIVASAARADLQIFIPQEEADSTYDFVVMLSRANADQRLCRGAETIYSVGRRGAVFSELRQISEGEKCP